MNAPAKITNAVEQAAATENRGKSAGQYLAEQVELNKPAIAASLPSGMTAERFARLLLTAAKVNPDLLACDPISFIAAGVQCATLGLEPNDARQYAYLVPFRAKDKKLKQVQVIIGYPGMIELSRRSGQIADIYAEAVYRSDFFEWELGLDRKLVHRRDPDGNDDPATLVYAYAVAVFKDGTKTFTVATPRHIARAKATSHGATSDYSPWKTDTADMWRKTALRRLWKMLPKSVEIAEAVERDEQAMNLGEIGLVLADAQPDHDDAIDVDHALTAGDGTPIDAETGELLPREEEP